MLIAFSASLPLTGIPWWVVPAVAGGAGVTLLCRRVLPRAVLWTAIIALLSIAFAIPLAKLMPRRDGILPRIALACAVLALVWSAAASFVMYIRRGLWKIPGAPSHFVTVANVVALLLGVVTAIILSVVLVMRSIGAGVELVYRVPWDAFEKSGFGAEGLLSLGFLFVACAISYSLTFDRRIGICAFWCVVITAAWKSLLSPALRLTETGGYQRTVMPLELLTALSTVLAITVAAVRLIGDGQDRSACACSTHPDRRRKGGGEESHLDLSVTPSGLQSSGIVVGVGVILLVCYHLAIPVPFRGGGVRSTMLLTAGSAALASGAGFVFLRKTWSVGVADVSLALASLSICSLATAAIGDEPRRLDERYPLVFNAMMFGFALATYLWARLALKWQVEGTNSGAPGTSGRLTPYIKRFAFLNGALALVTGILMSVWPRWPGIAATDDSLGRVAAGVSAHLFLLLVLLWCSHRLKRFTLQVLTVMTVIATAGFLLVRVAPFRPGFG